MATTNKKILETKPLAFELELSQSDDRLDCSWFNPIVENKIDKLKKYDRKLVRLKVLADVDGGKRLPKDTVISEDENNVIPYIRAIDVKDLKINLESAVKISKETHQGIQNYQLKQNDIAITIVGTIGEVGLLEDKVEVCDFTENVARVRITDESIVPKFLLHFLDSEYGKIQTERFSVGSLQYKLSLKSCRNIEVYLPIIKGEIFDKKFQEEILSDVYKIMKEADKKRQEARRLIIESRSVVSKKIGLPFVFDKKKFRIFNKEIDINYNSRLDTLFNNPLHDELLKVLIRFPHRKLNNLAKFQENNKTKPSDFYNLIELEEINEETGKISGSREVHKLESEKILLKKKTIILSKLQPEKGKIAIVDEKFDGYVASSELVPLVLESTEVTLEYLWAVLRSEYVLDQWQFQLTGSSRMRIGSNEIKNTIIPMVNARKQMEIVEQINDYLKSSEKLFIQANELNIKAKDHFVKLLVN